MVLMIESSLAERSKFVAQMWRRKDAILLLPTSEPH